MTRMVFWYGVKCIGLVSLARDAGAVISDSHLDLSRAPCVLYGVKYIDLVPLVPFSGRRDQRVRVQGT